MSWWGWIIGGAILLGAELAFVDAQFYLVFVGIAAIAGRPLSARGPVAGDRGRSGPLFAMLAIASMVSFRSPALPRLRGHLPGVRTGPAGGVLTLPAALAPGESCQVEHGGTFWTARNDSDTPIPCRRPRAHHAAYKASRCWSGPTPSQPQARMPACPRSYVFIVARHPRRHRDRKTAIVVPQQSAYVVENLGKYSRTLHAGFHILVPFVERVAYRHSLKEQAIDIPEQVCITRDNVQVGVDGVLYMQVLDPQRASYGITNYNFAISQLAQTTLRSEIGKIELDRTFEARGTSTPTSSPSSTRRRWPGA